MSGKPRYRLQGMRLLVVEDAAAVRTLIRSLLEMEGATVVEARTGREACEIAETQTFDVALTDLGLPDVSGEAVIARIRAVSQGCTPVAVVSGAPENDLAHALEVGAERTFAKPLDWDDLIGYLVRQSGTRTRM